MPVEVAMKRRRLLVGPAISLLAVLLAFPVRPAVAVEPVSVIEMDGAIGPVTVRLLDSALARRR